MCGIIGIVGRDMVAPALYDALTMLQHRGQDAAGIATLDGHRLKLHKDNGLVSDVFRDQRDTGSKCPNQNISSLLLFYCRISWSRIR